MIAKKLTTFRSQHPKLCKNNQSQMKFKKKRTFRYQKVLNILRFSYSNTTKNLDTTPTLFIINQYSEYPFFKFNISSCFRDFRDFFQFHILLHLLYRHKLLCLRALQAIAWNYYINKIF